MRAALLEQQRTPLRIVEVPTPEPGPKQIRLRVSCCAVCHTDLHIVEGDIPPHKMPVIPGHQIIGAIDKLGPEAGAFKLGDLVGIPWLHWTDGTCAYCHNGIDDLF